MQPCPNAVENLLSNADKNLDEREASESSKEYVKQRSI